MTNLSRGLSLASEFTKRTPAQACNQAALEISITVQRDTPFVTPESVDAELAVLVSPVIGVRGKPLKNKKRYSTEVGGVGQSKEVPLAVLIIMARARQGSNYNLLTNNRYALPGNPLKGLSKAAGEWLMASLVNAMIMNRHRSGHFIQIGWNPNIRQLLIADRGRKYGGSSVPQLNGGDQLGHATPAKTGDPSAMCIIENDVGGEGLNAASHNAALMVTTPLLQNSVDKEGRVNMQFFLDRAGKDELERQVNAAWK